MKWQRVRRRLVIFLAVVFGVFVGAAWWIGGSLVAPAQRSVGSPPDGMPVESLRLTTESGVTLAAWAIPAKNATSTVILLHANRGNRRSMLQRARLLFDSGYSTLLVDLQAHGESTGDRITAGHRERNDVVAAVNYIRSRTPDHKIGIVGCSLGGAATLLAMPLDIDALVLESVYPTISEAVHNRLSMRIGPLHYVLAPALLVQLKPRLGIFPSQLRPIDHLADVACPVLIAGGELDRHTTLAETERLYHAAHEPKQILVFNGAAHSDLLNRDPVKYRDVVLGFLEAHLKSTELENRPGPFR